MTILRSCPSSLRVNTRDLPSDCHQDKTGRTRDACLAAAPSPARSLCLAPGTWRPILSGSSAKRSSASSGAVVYLTAADNSDGSKTR